MSTRTSPPRTQRTSATAEEIGALQAVLGVRLPGHLAAVLLDPRGRSFQRLEWLGDGLLDGLVAVFLLTRGEPPQRHGQLTSDRVLAERADAAALPDLVDWTPSRTRLADVVEACVAAAWLVSPHDAAACAGRLLGVPLGVGPEQAATTPTPGCAGLRRFAAAGSHLLEAAASLQAFQDPARTTWDEGDLSRERAGRLSGRRILAANPLLPDCGPAEHRLDHLQARVAEVAVLRGVLDALLLAQQLLGELPGIDPTTAAGPERVGAPWTHRRRRPGVR